MINGVTKIVMTKADVLDSFPELQVCTSYTVNGKETREVPFQMDRSKPEAVYQSFPGWKTATSGFKSADQLPDTMRSYVDYINKYLGVSIHFISNGPGRDQIIRVEELSVSRR
jgi:adenylosuccinate synthase